MTPENIRFHAAGHIASAHLLAKEGHADAAKKVMQTVLAFTTHALVQAPPQVVAKVAACAESPNSQDMELLEGWFVDPLNSIIEATNG